MKKFIVRVDGNSYEVEVEEVGGSASPSNIANIDTQTNVETTPQAALSQNPEPAPAPKAAPSKSAAAGATTVNAPMPGNILDIKVAEGDVVEKGQVLCVLEAMKMENEIMSPVDGTIATVNTSKGVAVDSGDLLFSID